MSLFCLNCGTLNQEGATHCLQCGQKELRRPCPQCNVSLRDTARFCHQCGFWLHPSQPLAITESYLNPTCPNCQTVNRAEARFCQKCRHPFNLCPQCQSANRLTSRYCQACGASLPANAAKTEVAPPPTAPTGMVKCNNCGRVTSTASRFCQHCGQPPTPDSRQRAERYETGKLPANSVLRGSKGEEYLILNLLAKGGMGAVYKAVRPQDGSLWALKEMSENALGSWGRANTIKAFYEEARFLQTLRHDNLPQVMDVFADNHRHYMVMELIDGETLADILKQNPGQLAVSQVLDWGQQLCVVLHFLHNQTPPIIYRDLKPHNVMVERATNRVKLIDFGIARRFKQGQRADTILVGTHGYAAPEQYGDRQTDARSDIFALGATLHHLLTGQQPQKNELFNRPSIRQWNPGVPESVCQAVEKAMQARPEARHPDAAAMYEALTGQPLPPAASPYASGSPVIHLKKKG